LKLYRIKENAKDFKTKIKMCKMFCKGFLGTTVICLTISNLYRFWYYIEYDIDIINPKVTKYYTNRIG